MSSNEQWSGNLVRSAWTSSLAVFIYSGIYHRIITKLRPPFSGGLRSGRFSRCANVTIKRQYGYRKGYSHFVGIQQIRRIRIAIQNPPPTELETCVEDRTVSSRCERPSESEALIELCNHNSQSGNKFCVLFPAPVLFFCTYLCTMLKGNL